MPLIPRVPATALAFLAALVAAPVVHADVVVPDDQIVQGSGCFGFDCVDGESFDFDTLRLKENNLRLAFEDSSAAGPFPGTDWVLEANDTASGGLNRFSLVDRTAATTPFTVRGAAPTDSLVVSPLGRIGLGTADPGLKLHLAVGDTPGVRLEQSDAGGFTPQTWDVAGNEANFFVRDLTGGSRLPFRIRPGAPTSSIDIAASGDVGVGTASPTAKLHVSGGAGTTRALVAETSGTAATRELLALSNNGPVRQRFENTVTDAVDWLAGSEDATDFSLAAVGAGSSALTLTPGGRVSTAGALRQRADAAGTENRAAIDRGAFLTALAGVPVTSFTYPGAPTVRHAAPDPAAFRAAFGLGDGDAFIAPADMAAVALAGVQELAARGTAGPAGAPGPAGPAGASGTPGSAGSPADATALAKLTRRLATLEKSSASMRRTTTALRKRVTKLEQRVKRLRAR